MPLFDKERRQARKSMKAEATPLGMGPGGGIQPGRRHKTELLKELERTAAPVSEAAVEQQSALAAQQAGAVLQAQAQEGLPFGAQDGRQAMLQQELAGTLAGQTGLYAGEAYRGAEAQRQQDRQAALAGLERQYDRKRQTQQAWADRLFEGLGGAAEAAGPALMTSLLACWVAEELFGAESVLTHLARLWCATHPNNPFVKVYQKHGPTWALWLSQNAWAKPLVAPVWLTMAGLGWLGLRRNHA